MEITAHNIAVNAAATSLDLTQKTLTQKLEVKVETSCERIVTDEIGGILEVKQAKQWVQNGVSFA